MHPTKYFVLHSIFIYLFTELYYLHVHVYKKQNKNAQPVTIHCGYMHYRLIALLVEDSQSICDGVSSVV